MVYKKVALACRGGEIGRRMKRGPYKKFYQDLEWTPDLAYIVGLITTDGCLSSDKRHIDFTSKDIALIKTFKKCLHLNNNITTKTSGSSNKLYFRIQFGNVRFYRWLLKIGLTANKTKTISKLNIPDKYFFDFLRGHLDGDGYIRIFMDKVYPNSQRLYTIFLSYNNSHLKWLSSITNRLLGIDGFIRYGTRVWQLTYARKESLILLPKIYYNDHAPCLERKKVLLNNIKHY
ncbi:MAG: hypothetical protein NT135_02755 [Candidatus Berkelbacteria bacterium]|nr:hypothetical protein [Candidatus Berkelbacteria bacterium]